MLARIVNACALTPTGTDPVHSRPETCVLRIDQNSGRIAGAAPEEGTGVGRKLVPALGDDDAAGAIAHAGVESLRNLDLAPCQIACPKTCRRSLLRRCAARHRDQRENHRNDLHPVFPAPRTRSCDVVEGMQRPSVRHP